MTWSSRWTLVTLSWRAGPHVDLCHSEVKLITNAKLIYSDIHTQRRRSRERSGDQPAVHYSLATLKFEELANRLILPLDRWCWCAQRSRWHDLYWTAANLFNVCSCSHLSPNKQAKSGKKGGKERGGEREILIEGWWCSANMPQSKIDSKCFNLTKKVDNFLSLSNVGRTDLTPPGFWKELASDEEAVSRSVQYPGVD